MKKNVNKDFFKKWSSEMAYVLGFFFADGTVTKHKNGGEYFVLQIKDKKLLYSIRTALESDHKITKRIHKKDGSIFYRIQIGSKEICSDLSVHGAVPQKTKRMQLPQMPELFFGDFLRGYFDGDGNVWAGEIHKNE